jgi:hypothetical protein
MFITHNPAQVQLFSGTLARNLYHWPQKKPEGIFLIGVSQRRNTNQEHGWVQQSVDKPFIPLVSFCIYLVMWQIVLLTCPLFCPVCGLVAWLWALFLLFDVQIPLVSSSYLTSHRHLRHLGQSHLQVPATNADLGLTLNLWHQNSNGLWPRNVQFKL